jgi:ACR3 family arsenite efflux pump ArsB
MTMFYWTYVQHVFVYKSTISIVFSVQNTEIFTRKYNLALIFILYMYYYSSIKFCASFDEDP